ncbi:lipoprotein, partial [Pseudomonas monteilii]
MALALLQGCAGRREDAPETDPAKVRAQLLRLLPAQAKDRDGWARDIQVAFEAQRIAPSKSNLCAVLAVTEQESTFNADPQVPNLGRIAREEIDRRAARLHIPKLLVDGALKAPSGNGKSYQQRLQAVRSEKQLSELYDEVIARVPLGKTLLGGLNPVHTGGPMQVSIDFAEKHARDYPYS